MYYFSDPTMILLLPVIAFAAWAQHRVSSTFRRYADVRSARGMTAQETARSILDSNGLQDVAIEPVRGTLTDHYDPRTRVLRLSDSVYASSSIAALGVAAHEVGHAVQHAQHYGPLALRNGILPVAQFGSFAAWPLFFMGFFFQFPLLMDLGIFVFILAALFQVVTLPVELDASRRAITALTTNGILVADEVEPARKVLKAAALTYVAAVLMAVIQLVRLLVLRSSRD